MSNQLRLTRQARNDLVAIWVYTYEQYDERQAEAYEDLIWEAMQTVCADPMRATTKPRPELAEGIRSYRIELRIPELRSRIHSARHVVYYDLDSSGEVRILRILHDSMDPICYLTPPID